MPVSFPTLSVGQVVAHPTRAYDPSLRSQKEDGLIISRRKYTGNKQQFEIKYDNITAADRILLETLLDDVGVGADTVTWTNEDPNDGSTYIVRFSPDAIKFKNKVSDYRLYTAEWVFIEA